jgi:tripartite-type tricarboxylate transporter receptor subunit TctC
MIMPLAAGGGLDTIGRLLAEQIRRSLGQPVIIENVTGADGSIGTGRVDRDASLGRSIDCIV